MKFLILVFLLLLIVPTVSAAHYIVGIVNDARDGMGANGHTVVLWNPIAGEDDNLTDIIGPSGNSGADNIYMIDCELLNITCNIGDEMRIEVMDNGDSYITNYTNVTVTGAGYDVAENLTLNSPPNITLITVDDSITVPAGEIDLVTAATRTVTCEAIIEELDGQSLKNISAEFFHSSSSYGSLDDNNDHYTNYTCYVDGSYGGPDESQIFCEFEVEYYANPGQWECILKAEDNFSVPGNGSALTIVNTLLSIGLVSSLDFGIVNATSVSSEVELNVTNYGNVMVNLSLSGYAVSEQDNLSMNCSLGRGKNISIGFEKYNLTASNPGSLSLSESETKYSNLTGSPDIKEFNLDYRTNDAQNYAINETYWRVYVPLGVAGDCSGSILFGASQAAGD